MEYLQATELKSMTDTAVEAILESSKEYVMSLLQSTALEGKYTCTFDTVQLNSTLQTWLVGLGYSIENGSENNTIVVSWSGT